MKKLVLSLLCAGAMSISATASALPTQTPFNVFIVNGPGTTIPVGTMFFDLDADLTAIPTTPYAAFLRGCRYYVEWDNWAYMPISADGFVVETKAHGAASCVANAYRAITSIVQNDGVFYGFDRFQQFSQVAQLLVSENAYGGNMDGLIQYGYGAVPSAMLNSISIQPAPY
jgi:hypothetical protein